MSLFIYECITTIVFKGVATIGAFSYLAFLVKFLKQENMNIDRSVG